MQATFGLSGTFVGTMAALEHTRVVESSLPVPSILVAAVLAYDVATDALTSVKHDTCQDVEVFC